MAENLDLHRQEELDKDVEADLDQLTGSGGLLYRERVCGEVREKGGRCRRAYTAGVYVDTHLYGRGFRQPPTMEVAEPYCFNTWSNLYSWRNSWRNSCLIKQLGCQVQNVLL